jgi:hypothetical protein
MARSLQIDRPGAWRHVMHRGARREPIFRGDGHCLLFLGGVDEAVGHHGLELHAYSLILMPNHDAISLALPFVAAGVASGLGRRHDDRGASVTPR